MRGELKTYQAKRNFSATPEPKGAKGKARIEGKDYVMQDGDVVEFRFNV